MNPEETDAMLALDHRLRKLYAGLDTRPGFEERVQARVAALAAAPTAELRERLEREHDRARAAANRATRMDGVAIAIAGVGALLGVWRFGPELASLYTSAVESGGPVLMAFGTLAVAGVALWALLRHLHVNARALVGV